MRLIYLVLFILCTILVMGLCYLNISNVIGLELGTTLIKVNVGFLLLGTAFYGGFASMFLLTFLGMVSGSEKKLKQKADDAKLKVEIESDKVKQLEAKIKTLEKALETLGLGNRE